jgi:hypothetical protein
VTGPPDPQRVAQCIPTVHDLASNQIQTLAYVVRAYIYMSKLHRVRKHVALLAISTTTCIPFPLSPTHWTSCWKTFPVIDEMRAATGSRKTRSIRQRSAIRCSATTIISEAAFQHEVLSRRTSVLLVTGLFLFFESTPVRLFTPRPRSRLVHGAYFLLLLLFQYALSVLYSWVTAWDRDA